MELWLGPQQMYSYFKRRKMQNTGPLKWGFTVKQNQEQNNIQNYM
jgi:hypothetical protein